MKNSREEPRTVGALLRALRKFYGFTEDQVAGALKCPVGYYKDLERVDRLNVDKNLAMRLGTVLGIPNSTIKLLNQRSDDKVIDKFIETSQSIVISRMFKIIGSITNVMNRSVGTELSSRPEKVKNDLKRAEVEIARHALMANHRF